MDIADAEDGSTPLIVASLQGYNSIAKLLLLAGAATEQLPFGGSFALLEASQAGHLEVCDTLLKAGADVVSAKWQRKFGVKIIIYITA